ncbi:hypothetical protein [Corynebacterium frankenforstense]
MGTTATVSAVLAAEEADPASPWPIYFMFAVAGLMVGATISAYQNDARKLTVFCALVAAAAVATAVVMLIGGVR